MPAALRTFVVVPTILHDEADVASSVRQLEVHFLANSGGDVRFALLSDGVDADQAELPEDATLVAAAAAGIDRLNHRYGPAVDGETRFFLFHRRRQWSPTQRKWMGWERKRGKLHEFNRLLRGAQDTSFLAVGGKPPQAPAQVKYVVTLDADTRLPIGVGGASWWVPLRTRSTRPRLDANRQRVVEGYAILQPRVTPKLPAASESSLFQRLYSAPSGVDLYAGAVSDVYQDLFGEGSYHRQGAVRRRRLRGVAGRAPARGRRAQSRSAGKRLRALRARQRCRGLRGLSLSRGGGHGTRASLGARRLAAAALDRRESRNRHRPISRWKMIDNLRRSLVAPTALATLVASWSIPHAPWLAWLVAIVAALSLPAWLAWLRALRPPPRGVSLAPSLASVQVEELNAAACLRRRGAGDLVDAERGSMVDAIARTLYRLVSRRNLLEWVTAAQVQGSVGLTLRDFLWPLRSASLVAVLAQRLRALLQSSIHLVRAADHRAVVAFAAGRAHDHHAATGPGDRCRWMPPRR